MNPANPRGDAPRAQPTPAMAPDIWLLAVSLAAGLGTARLTQAPGAAHVVGPITAAVLAGHLAASVARRLRVSTPVVAGAGVVAVVLATVWGELFSATRYGIPTLQTWRTLVSEFGAAGTVIRSHPTPVPATPEVVLCIAMGAGLVAVFARAIWAWQEARGSGALAALVPTFGLFCYTALLSSQVDRLAGTIAYLVCALAFVISADHSTSESRSVPRRTASGPPAVSTRRRLASGFNATLPAALGAVVAVLVPLAASPALATLKVDALPFAQPGGSRGAQGPGLAVGGSADGGGLGSGTAVLPGSAGVRAIDLVDDLKAVLVNRTTELMFSAQTPLPTYWQLAVLTRFNGTAWLPDPTTEAAAQSDALLPPSRGVPELPALPEPAATKTFRAQVTIANLESTLLPLPPSTISVGTVAEVVPGFGALQPFEAAPGLSYVAVVRIPAGAVNAAPSTGAGPAGAGAGPAGASAGAGGISPTSLAPYLHLPTEPASVVQLAHQIVAGAAGPAAEAAALARWFDTGRYRYTLSPPKPTGRDALESFLFTTRAGFCQQFAAAYAVLARIDGLPTRVAVGFTTGATRGHGEYRVTGADAHVWPEVYLGPSTGWTSYEPTPASAGEAAGVGINTGSRTGAQSPGARSTATTAPSPSTVRRPGGANAAVPSTSPTVPHGATPAAASNGRSWWATLVLVVAGMALVALAVAAGLWVRRREHRGGAPLPHPGLRLRLRRHRRRRRAAPDPTAEVLARWRDAEIALERARLGRRPAETLQEHASRLAALAGAKWLVPYRPVTASSPAPPNVEPSIEATVDAYGKLAALAARASYSSDPCTAEDAADAGLLGDVVRSGLGRPTGRRRVPVPF
ncbi:MAG TPA: transglutaminaseTgpA domain-containing protein [Acidimicrobiales bacterium]|nr:transglutaminaseTgpA domain-containing protein [Acidimicrobiales bacterium]